MRLDPLSVDDAGAVLSATITDDSGALDITGATVSLLLKKGTTYIARTADIVNPAVGTVTYETVAGDLPTAGIWKLQWRVEWAGGADLFFPPIPHDLPVENNLIQP